MATKKFLNENFTRGMALAMFYQQIKHRISVRNKTINALLVHLSQKLLEKKNSD